MRNQRGYGAIQCILGVAAVLVAALTWLIAAAGLRRYRGAPAAEWTELAPAIALGAVAVLFAGLTVYTAAVNRGRGRRLARIAQDPARPWLVIEEWARGRIRDAPAAGAAAFIGAFAAVWNLVVGGTILAVRGRADLRADASTLVFLALFGLAGVGLLALAVYVARGARKFGRATFEMLSVPGVLGGWLRGTITLPQEVPGGAEARLSLTCARRSTGSGRLSFDDWKEEVTVVTAPSIPVAFRIPFNLPESDLPDMPTKGVMQVSWVLVVNAELPGVDYSAAFNVPVFRTEESDGAFLVGSGSESPSVR